MYTNNVLSTSLPLPAAPSAQSDRNVKSTSQSTILERIGHVVRTVEQKRDGWSGHAISFFDQVNLKLNAFPHLSVAQKPVGLLKLNDVPQLFVLMHHSIQNKLDDLGRHIERMFAPLKKFNEWLNSNGLGSWYRQLATFLVKLPLRAVRNILQMLYQIVRGCCYFAVHPLKSIVQLAQLMVRLLAELTKPETWSKIAGGCLGASFGQALITGSPLSLVGIGIGAACLLGGLSIGALRAALLAQAGNRLQAAWTNFATQLKQLPEKVLTGFLMGIMIGAVQNAVRKAAYRRTMKDWKVTSYEEAKRFVDEFIKAHNLPWYSSISLKNGTIIIKWEGAALQKFEQAFPEFFKRHLNQPPWSERFQDQSFTVELSRSHAPHCIFKYKEYANPEEEWDPEWYNRAETVPCEKVGIEGTEAAYPSPPPLPHVSSKAAIAGDIAIAQQQLLEVVKET
jgi:hypothetical protein